MSLAPVRPKGYVLQKNRSHHTKLPIKPECHSITVERCEDLLKDYLFSDIKEVVVLNTSRYNNYAVFRIPCVLSNALLSLTKGEDGYNENISDLTISCCICTGTNAYSVNYVPSGCYSFTSTLLGLSSYMVFDSQVLSRVGAEMVNSRIVARESSSFDLLDCLNQRRQPIVTSEEKGYGAR